MPMSRNQGSDQVPLNVWLVGGRHAEPASRLDVSMAVIDAYTDPGDVVVDLVGADGEILGAITSAGRSVVAPTEASGRLRAHDDLVADLVLAVPIGVHRPPPWCRVLNATARELLGVGGLFVTLPFPTGRGADPVSATVASAAEAGLDYFQHVVVLDPRATPRRSGDVSVDGRHVDLLAFRRGR